MMLKYDLNPNSDVFHLELRKARIDRGLTQTQLAEALGISKVMPQRYEADPKSSNSARPNALTAKKIKDFFLGASEKEGVIGVSLSSIPLEDLLSEIGRRGYQVNLLSK